MNQTRIAVRRLRKGHTYIVRFDPIDEEAAIKSLRSWALNPELNFDFGDRQKMDRQIRSCCARG